MAGNKSSTGDESGARGNGRAEVRARRGARGVNSEGEGADGEIGERKSGRREGGEGRGDREKD